MALFGDHIYLKGRELWKIAVKVKHSTDFPRTIM